MAFGAFRSWSAARVGGFGIPSAWTISGAPRWRAARTRSALSSIESCWPQNQAAIGCVPSNVTTPLALYFPHCFLLPRPREKGRRFNGGEYVYYCSFDTHARQGTCLGRSHASLQQLPGERLRRRAKAVEVGLGD